MKIPNSIQHILLRRFRFNSRSIPHMKNKFSGAIKICYNRTSCSFFWIFNHMRHIDSVTFQSVQQTFSKIVFAYSSDNSALMSESRHCINKNRRCSARIRSSKNSCFIQWLIFFLPHNFHDHFTHRPNFCHFISSPQNVNSCFKNVKDSFI